MGVIMRNRYRKKYISFILACVMCLGTVAVVPTVTFAANNSARFQAESIAQRTITRTVLLKSKKKKVRNASRIPVLTYHRILADNVKKSPAYKNDRYALAVSEFNKQMKWLKKKHYRAITCDELYLWRIGKLKLPKRSVLITIDDGHGASIENAISVLNRYGLKATAFIEGKPSYDSNGSYYITYSRIKEIQKNYPNTINFQSHTYNLHRPTAFKTETYQSVMSDAAQQKKMYGFSYLAYPHGKQSPQMINAYKNSGIKMAFLFGKSGYATRKQNLYKIRRIEVKGDMKLRKFKRWCK